MSFGREGEGEGGTASGNSAGLGPRGQGWSLSVRDQLGRASRSLVSVLGREVEKGAFQEARSTGLIYRP